MRTRVVANVLVAIVMCAAASNAAAQSGSTQTAPGSGTPAMDISAGYSYLREEGTGGQVAKMYDKGWVAAFSQRVGRIAVVGEAGGSYRLDDFGERQSLYGFLGGVRIGLIKVLRVRAFAQALAGVEYFSQPGFSEHGLAFQPGGGLDLQLGGAFGLRVQGDFRIAHEEDVNFKEGRFTASLVIGIR